MRRVIDIETLANCFTMVGYDVDTKETRKFVIHKSRNDYEEWREYIQESTELIGFNIKRFDYPVIHPFVIEPFDEDGDTIAKTLYKRAQKIIDQMDNRNKKPEWITPICKITDLYLMYHFNNKARSTSLKWLQVNMAWKNVQEMPLSHKTKVTPDQIPMILEYNENDVMSTHEFWLRSQKMIEFRKDLSGKFKVDMTNYPDTKIGERIFLVELEKLTGKSQKELSQGRTHRSRVDVKDVLLDSIYFTSDIFRGVLEEYKQKTVDPANLKANKNITVVFDGVTYDFGLGGLHGLRSPGVYHDVVDVDVSSYYPNLSIVNSIYPQHLGIDFCVVYKQLYEQRKLHKKGTSENGALKLSLNGTFGTFNAPWSPFYDPRCLVATTVLGQFILAMLCERLTLLRAARIIMANTDGISVEIIDREKFDKTCDLWQKEFTLTLEYATYKKLAIANVNNYIGVFDNGKVKEKGQYETDKTLWKTQSMKIVSKAVREYFVNDTPITKTISECNDIGQFLIGHRAKTGNLRYRKIDGSELINETLPKTMRYYISYSGGSMVKVTKGTKKKKKDYVISPNQLGLFGVKPSNDEVTNVEKITNLHVGYNMTLFNKWINKPFEEYGINKRFYITEAQKLIDAVTKVQVSI